MGGGLINTGKRRRISVVQKALPGLRLRLDPLDIRMIMKKLNGRLCRLNRFTDTHQIAETQLLGPIPESIHTVRAERVPVPEPIGGQRITDINTDFCEAGHGKR